ncbi:MULTISPECIES: hypothetical protein [unclassified Modestobacter]|uniref:hypothetical protein n=1 Tax=unclassified Modestobacter TaxID=2643866 RepID=UPI0022AA820C|nr:MULTISPECIES: hypothetical protein [unclassified Modestobacter]MCZ2823785.1 hypothetical protein [Modestobacter sp. VKM Ac-2981]MCZ2852030.1 hypothetical protein [Modestobacter sp. VKM Ac-2982]
MSPETAFVSHARNHEDVVLWRALGHLPSGRYVEVSSRSTAEGSVGRAFADRGWHGLSLDVTPEDAGRAAGLDARMSAGGWAPGDDLHFVAVAAPGATSELLRGVDLQRLRPWVLVVELAQPEAAAERPEDWEDDLRAAGYTACLFDGISRFYVAADRAAELGDALGHPACARDGFISRAHLSALELNQELVDQTTHWRTQALTRWADAVSLVEAREDGDDERELLRRQVLAFQQTLSWRVTRPLRAVRPLLGRVRVR